MDIDATIARVTPLVLATTAGMDALALTQAARTLLKAAVADGAGDVTTAALVVVHLASERIEADADLLTGGVLNLFDMMHGRATAALRATLRERRPWYYRGVADGRQDVLEMLKAFDPSTWRVVTAESGSGDSRPRRSAMRRVEP